MAKSKFILRDLTFLSS